MTLARRLQLDEPFSSWNCVLSIWYFVQERIFVLLGGDVCIKVVHRVCVAKITRIDQFYMYTGHSIYNPN